MRKYLEHNKTLLALILLLALTIGMWSGAYFLNQQNTESKQQLTQILALKSDIYNYQLLFSDLTSSHTEQTSESPYIAFNRLIDANQQSLILLQENKHVIQAGLEGNIKQTVRELDKIREIIDEIHIAQQDVLNKFKGIYSDIDFTENLIAEGLRLKNDQEQLVDFKEIVKMRKQASESQSVKQLDEVVLKIDKIGQACPDDKLFNDKLKTYRNYILIFSNRLRNLGGKGNSVQKQKFDAYLHDYFNYLSENESEMLKYTSRNNVGNIIAVLLLLPLFLIALYLLLILKQHKNFKQNIHLVFDKLIKGEKLTDIKLNDGKLSDKINEFENLLEEQNSNILKLSENIESASELDIPGDYKITKSVKLLAKKVQHGVNEQIKARAIYEQRSKYLETLGEFNDILRNNQKGLSEMSFTLVAKLSEFLDIDIVGMYIADKHKVLNLLGAYAYNVKKMSDLSVKFGEGLVGTCASENNIIFLPKIEADYLKMTTSLGQIAPKYLYLFPISVEDTVFGVLEMASVEKINEVNLDFIKKLTKDIALTLSLMKIENEEITEA